MQTSAVEVVLPNEEPDAVANAIVDTTPAPSQRSTVITESDKTESTEATVHADTVDAAATTVDDFEDSAEATAAAPSDSVDAVTETEVDGDTVAEDGDLASADPLSEAHDVLMSTTVADNDSSATAGHDRVEEPAVTAGPSHDEITAPEAATPAEMVLDEQHVSIKQVFPTRGQRRDLREEIVDIICFILLFAFKITRY